MDEHKDLKKTIEELKKQLTDVTEKFDRAQQKSDHVKAKLKCHQYWLS